MVFLGLLLIAAISIGIAIPIIISYTNPSTDSCSGAYISAISTHDSTSHKGKIMIVGGATYKDGHNFYYNTTEIIDLDDENSSCHLTTDYPYKASLIQAGGLNVCGKLKNVFCSGGTEYVILRSCYEYSTDGFLEMSDFHMNQVIGSASAVQISDDFGEQLLWIMGGRDSDYMLQSSTQLISYTRGLLKGPEMPDKIVNHCAVALKNTTVMVIGGQSGPEWEDRSQTYWYNFELEQWIHGPDLSIARGRHACAVFETENETRIYVVGGVNQQFDDLDSVEIAVLDQDSLETMEWKWTEGKVLKELHCSTVHRNLIFPGPKFPFGIREHALVSTKLGLYAVGGYRWKSNEDNYSDSIFELNPISNNSTWIELPQKMIVPRSYVAALFLPKEFSVTCQ